MIKKTAKFVKACGFIARKYNVTLTHVLSEETGYTNVYAEMRGDGLVWSSGHQEWVLADELKNKMQHVPARQKSISIRVTSYDDPEFASAVADLIAEFIATSGGTVSRVSRSIANNNNNGARVYVEGEI